MVKRSETIELCHFLYLYLCIFLNFIFFLFSKAPLACRNFIQLSLEGYYDGNEVHRVIKDFMIQTGDPTGTGKGGSSIWGRPFKDEIHGRIKFNHRGQVAMANENRPNTNQSQFIITLGECDWLNRKHTIFGKVTQQLHLNDNYYFHLIDFYSLS
jgi:cyclophilin family peptidyl-prolyl cis-trans isomerase